MFICSCTWKIISINDRRGPSYIGDVYMEPLLYVLFSNRRYQQLLSKISIETKAL